MRPTDRRGQAARRADEKTSDEPAGPARAGVAIPASVRLKSSRQSCFARDVSCIRGREPIEQLVPTSAFGLGGSCLPCAAWAHATAALALRVDVYTGTAYCFFTNGNIDAVVETWVHCTYQGFKT